MVHHTNCVNILKNKKMCSTPPVCWAPKDTSRTLQVMHAPYTSTNKQTNNNRCLSLLTMVHLKIFPSPMTQVGSRGCCVYIGSKRLLDRGPWGGRRTWCLDGQPERLLRNECEKPCHHCSLCIGNSRSSFLTCVTSRRL